MSRVLSDQDWKDASGAGMALHAPAQFAPATKTRGGMILQRAELISTKALHLAQAFGCTVCIFSSHLGKESATAIAAKRRFCGNHMSQSRFAIRCLYQAKMLWKPKDIFVCLRTCSGVKNRRGL